MSNAILAHSNRSKYSALRSARLVTALTVIVWLSLVLWLGAAHVFVAPRGTPPLALLIAVTAPVILFLAGFSIWPLFREFVLSSDLRLMTAMQAWRIGGFMFLVLYSLGILPGFFAWPAGLGDMAIGITAPLILVGLIRKPSSAASKTFLAWNAFGILDLVVAVGSGAFGARFLNTAANTATTAPMAHLPLVLIPGFFVPLFIVLHIAALIQARRLA